MKRWLQKSVVIILILALGFLMRWAQHSLDQHAVIRFVDKNPVFLPKGETLKWLSMGYRGLVADWLWINTVLYFGRRVVDEENPYYQYMIEKGNLEEEFKTRSTAPVLPDSVYLLDEKLKKNLYRFESRGLVDDVYPILDRLTTVDPHFIFPYLFGGVYVLHETGEIDAARNLLEKGYSANPDQWEFPFYLGWIHWIYRGDLRRTYRYLLEAVGMKGCPGYVNSLLNGISGKLQSDAFTKLYLEGLVKSTDNPEIRDQIQQYLNQIENGGNK